MDSSPNLSHNHAKDVPKQCEIFLTGKYPSSRRTASFSSCSSSLSPSSSSLESIYFPDDPLLSPASPLRFSGVPFSWEQLPGIPKKHNSNKNKKSSMKLLPLPPPKITTTHSSKKFNHDNDTKIWKKNSIQNSFQRDDPFFAAMVKCSKDDNEEITNSNLWNNNGAKVSRSISDRFGFISLYGSCKRTCAVSESLVLLPTTRRSTYQQVNGRSL
ncbi:hypothetical protein P8452_10025 [Trifolium repens]|jgi:hypothetical protein|nr:hypothetical protein QL285_005035 [Trifolium repens]WJX14244.1 hypothetical protein P8452_04538 [Trifolium repens]WJX20473.1 hypothetical protein P8452_10025 [Trifolium repens]